MKIAIQLAVLLLLLGGLGAAYGPATRYWKERNKPRWRTVEVEEGRIVATVNATGEIKPVLSVRVGSFVSGPITELHADFNQEVKEGDLLAQIDQRIYLAEKQRAEATLATARADVKRVQALLSQAENDESRAIALQAENAGFISQAELDQLKFARMSLEAQLEIANASIQQATALLENASANLDYTRIRSPVDGIIIDRKIDPGQTLAAQFQTPELFVVAPRMRETMHVFASVDEADIGMIRNAKEKGQPVFFTVDAYRDDLFEGVIEEIRLSSTQIQNVVTYPVVVAAPNPDLKLLPGMTASISFRVDERAKCVRIPNAALRFYPPPEHVRPEDKEILEGQDWEQDQQYDVAERTLSAEEKAEARRQRNRRHVWTVQGDKLRAVEVVTGLSDSKFTELVEGDLAPGQILVSAVKPKPSGWFAAAGEEETPKKKSKGDENEDAADGDESDGDDPRDSTAESTDGQKESASAAAARGRNRGWHEGGQASAARAPRENANPSSVECDCTAGDRP